MISEPMPSILLGDLALTGRDAADVMWVVPRDALKGWWGSPAGTGESAQRFRGDGVWVGSQWLAARTVTIEGWILAHNYRESLAALARLSAATSLDLTLLQVSWGGDSTQALVRRDDEVLTTWVSDRRVKWSIQLLAPDPRRVTTTLRTVTVSLPSVTGGLTVPLTVPIQIAQTVTGGSVSMTSTGSIGGPVRLLLVGPLVNPEIAHEPSGRTLALTTEIRAGQTLVVDMTDSQRRTVTLDGVSRMNSLTQRGWHAFEPGLNTWRLSAASGSGHLTVEARDAWT